MKKILAGALALSLLTGAAASAQPHNDRHDNGRHEGQYDNGRHDNGHQGGPAYGGGGHQWRKGERLPSNYRTRDHYVDYRAHHLRAPPRGYRWVQADNNYALVAVTTGLIASLIASSN